MAQRLSLSAVRASSAWFTDESGRVLMLRGVNLGGNVKMPAAPPVTTFTTDPALFFEHRAVSFVGRPLALDTAEEHLLRLRSWGFLFLRFLVTWEAIEHAGPGQHDDDYIDYVVRVLELARRHGFRVFIDPHQDVWSRFTGGSGAPGWTLEAAGLDMRKFKHNDAAIVQNTWADDDADVHDFPKMIWPSNYNKYAAATMFTLFFGGKTFAPNTLVDGVNIEEYLQGHYIRAMQHLAARVRHVAVVVGYDTLNEPSGGLIGCHDLDTHPRNQILKKHLAPTPFQSMKLASGIPTLIDWYERTWYSGIGKTGQRMVNEQRESAFLPGHSCPWLTHGVWDRDGEQLLRPRYFIDKPDGGVYDFLADFWLPFAARYTAAIRAVDPEAIIFVEPLVNEPPPRFPSAGEAAVAGPLVYAPHWYDGLTLFNKAYSFWNVDVLALSRGELRVLNALQLGSTAIRASFARQIGQIRREGLELIGRYPCLVGETGIPFDLNERQAYGTNDYSKQIEAMDATLAAMDANLINYTIWNYNPLNENESGDFWNGEDFSIFSRNAPPLAGDDPTPVDADASPAQTPHNSADDDAMPSVPAATQAVAVPGPLGGAGAFASLSGVLDALGLRLPFSGPRGFIHFEKELDRGGRALQAVIRPYALKTAGEPVSMSFDIHTKVFKYAFRNRDWLPTDDDTATEIYLPHYHFGISSNNFLVQVSDGLYTYHADEQLLVYRHGSLNVDLHTIIVMRRTVL